MKNNFTATTHKIEHTLRPSLLKENKGRGWQIITILTLVSNTYVAIVNDLNQENHQKYYTFRIYKHYLFSLILGSFMLFFMGLVLYTCTLLTAIHKGVNHHEK